jgi:hypothetical protein
MGALQLACKIGNFPDNQGASDGEDYVEREYHREINGG